MYTPPWVRKESMTISSPHIQTTDTSYSTFYILFFTSSCIPHPGQFKSSMTYTRLVYNILCVVLYYAYMHPPAHIHTTHLYSLTTSILQLHTHTHTHSYTHYSTLIYTREPLMLRAYAYVYMQSRTHRHMYMTLCITLNDDI